MMKLYETPEFVKIDFLTEDVLGSSIIDTDNTKDPVELGPAIDIFG